MEAGGTPAPSPPATGQKASLQWCHVGPFLLNRTQFSQSFYRTPLKSLWFWRLPLEHTGLPWHAPWPCQPSHTPVAPQMAVLTLSRVTPKARVRGMGRVPALATQGQEQAHRPQLTVSPCPQGAVSGTMSSPYCVAIPRTGVIPERHTAHSLQNHSQALLGKCHVDDL